MLPKLGDQKWRQNTLNIKEGIDFMNELLEKQTSLKLETGNQADSHPDLTCVQFSRSVMSDSL